MENRTPITLYPSKMKTGIYLLLSLGFVAAGIWMVLNHEPLGWLAVGFFGICALAFIITLIPGSSYLKLDEAGFEIRTLFRKESYRWEDIERFGWGKIGRNKMVVLNFKPGYQGQALGRKVGRAVTGVEGALPDTYGKSPEELAEMMNAWKDRQ